MLLESTLEYIWHHTGIVAGSAPKERDYLRTIHHPSFLWLWSHSIRLELRQSHSSVTISSIWVDHTPNLHGTFTMKPSIVSDFMGHPLHEIFMGHPPSRFHMGHPPFEDEITTPSLFHFSWDTHRFSWDTHQLTSWVHMGHPPFGLQKKAFMGHPLFDYATPPHNGTEP